MQPQDVARASTAETEGGQVRTLFALVLGLGVVLAAAAAGSGWWLTHRTTAPATTEPAPSGTSATSPASASAVPATPVIIGPWQIAVLSTDHDARDEIGLGNHPEDYPEVLTTIQLTNISDVPQTIDTLVFDFASPDGTASAYNPWDDWCAPVDSDISLAADYYLPGESHTGTVCVPVDPIDAAGLEMWPWIDMEDGDTALVTLLPEGETRAAPPTADLAALQEVALAAAGRSGDVEGYRFTVAAVEVGDPVDGRSEVRITLAHDPVEGADSPESFLVVPMAVTPSGWTDEFDHCGAEEMWYSLGGTRGTQQLCVTVDVDDADQLLLFMPPNRLAEAGALMDARPTEG